MKITVKLTPEEATTPLTEHFSNLLAIGPEQIHVGIAVHNQHVDIGAVLKFLIAPMVASPDKKIEAIRTLRAICPNMSLATAKWAVENFDKYLATCIGQNSLMPATA